MIIKQLLDEDFVNYKKPSMFIAFPCCSFKCDKEAGVQVCQNGALAAARSIDIDEHIVVDRYVDNNITKAVVIGGLEPMDSFAQLLDFIKALRARCDDDIIIYTGYRKNEVMSKVVKLAQFANIIIKYGRFIPNSGERYDSVLGVVLASDNQFAERIS